VLSLRQDGRTWVVEFGAERLVLPDRVGLRYLAQLVANPGRSISARDLAAGEVGAAAATGRSGGSRQEVLDTTARAALERRAHELAAQIAAARERGDELAQATAEDELDAIADELRRATGLAHRDRFFDDDAERARTAVRKAVVRAVNEIAAGLPAVGDHLRRTITTGVDCRYEPHPPASPAARVDATIDLRTQDAHP
jgi:hypothetical protein